MALQACTQQNSSSSKNTESHSQKQGDSLNKVDLNKKQKAFVDDNQDEKEVMAKLKFVKPVPVDPGPMPEPWPYPEPDPVPYPFPEPLPIPLPEKRSMEEEILEFAEVAPEFPGGIEALMKFIQANIIYPELDRELGNEGKVYVGFVVMKSGEITNIKIMRGIKDAPNLDKEAIRIVKMMPLWTPGMNNGQKVNVRTIIPIRFSLK